MKKLKILTFVLAFAVVLSFGLFTPNVNVSADVRGDNVELFKQEIALIENGYDIITELHYYDDTVTSEQEQSAGISCTQRLSGYSQAPVVTANNPVVIDVTDYDVIALGIARAYKSNGSWTTGSEGALKYGALLFNVKEKDDLQVFQDYVALDVDFADGDFCIFDVYLLRKTETIDDAVYFKNVQIDSISHYYDFLKFRMVGNYSPLNASGIFDAGYMQGLHYGALDYINNDNDHLYPILPESAIGWSQSDVNLFEQGFGAGYGDYYLSDVDFSDYDGVPDPPTPPTDPNPPTPKVEVFDYNGNLRGTITCNIGDKITLEQVNDLCGAVLDVRWNWQTASGTTRQEWDFSNDVVMQSIMLTPRGVNVEIYDTDYDTLLGAYYNRYNQVATHEQFAQACGGTLPAQRFSKLLRYIDAHDNAVAEIVEEFDFSAPLTTDQTLTRLQYNVEISDAETGEKLREFKVDPDTVFTQNFVAIALGNNNYNVGIASTKDAELSVGDVINDDLLILVTKKAQENSNGNTSSTASSGKTSADKGLFNGFKFGLNTSLISTLLMILVGFVVIKSLLNKK